MSAQALTDSTGPQSGVSVLIKSEFPRCRVRRPPPGPGPPGAGGGPAAARCLRTVVTASVAAKIAGCERGGLHESPFNISECGLANRLGRGCGYLLYRYLGLEDPLGLLEPLGGATGKCIASLARV
jgi:hypothetical protein